MKYYFLGLLAVLGLAGTAFGAWAKITHQTYVGTAITIGLISRAIGLIALACLLLLWLRKKETK